MFQCQKCQGLVPDAESKCPNCSSSSRWWSVPLAIAGGALCTVTLSACYGPACAATVKLPDGGIQNYNRAFACMDYDCTQPLADGGVRENDSTWQMVCTDGLLGTTDAGKADGGADGGTDGGTDAGP